MRDREDLAHILGERLAKALGIGRHWTPLVPLNGISLPAYISNSIGLRYPIFECRRFRLTIRFKNAHGTVFRELLYHWHPWFGMRVAIHETVDKVDGVVFRCTLSGSAADRWLEVPAWMFDRARCLDPSRLTASPHQHKADYHNQFAPRSSPTTP